jgi:hypothetical protein
VNGTELQEWERWIGEVITIKRSRLGTVIDLAETYHVGKRESQRDESIRVYPVLRGVAIHLFKTDTVYRFESSKEIDAYIHGVNL